MNLRVFKKDIEFCIDQFLADCDLVLMLNPNANVEDIYKIEDEAFDLHNDLKVRANHPEGNKKAFYKGLIEEMYNKLDELSEKLSATVVIKEK